LAGLKASRLGGCCCQVEEQKKHCSCSAFQQLQQCKKKGQPNKLVYVYITENRKIQLFQSTPQQRQKLNLLSKNYVCLSQKKKNYVCSNILL
jgi:hypothetical protein